MQIHSLPRRSKAGFTIVELLIVIVVIAILAAITIVAFNGVQQRARDTERKTELSQIAKLLDLYKIDKGGYPGSATGCASGLNGFGSGWYNHEDGTATWPKSVMKCLIEAGFTSANLLDPSKATYCANYDLSCHAYLITTCAAGTWVLINLETAPQNSTFTDSMCGGAGSWDTLYGVNFAVQVE